MNTFLDALSEPSEEFLSFIDLLRYRAQNQPEQTAYIFLDRGETEGNTLTYQQLDERARGIAAKLQQLDAIGKRALLLYPPGLELASSNLKCIT